MQMARGMQKTWNKKTIIFDKIGGEEKKKFILKTGQTGQTGQEEGVGGSVTARRRNEECRETRRKGWEG